MSHGHQTAPKKINLNPSPGGSLCSNSGSHQAALRESGLMSWRNNSDRKSLRLSVCSQFGEQGGVA